MLDPQSVFVTLQAQLQHSQILVLPWALLFMFVFFLVIAVLLFVRLLLSRRLRLAMLGLAGIAVGLPLMLGIGYLSLMHRASRPLGIDVVEYSGKDIAEQWLAEAPHVRIHTEARITPEQPKIDLNSEMVTAGADEPTAESDAIPVQPRPAWVDQPNRRVGETERRVVTVGPWDSVEECHRLMDVPILDATRKFMQHEFGADDLTTDDLGQVGVNIAYVLREICTEEYVETTEHDFGEGISNEMMTLHVLMEFGPSVRDDLQRRLRESQLRENAKGVSLAAGAIFGVLSLVYLLLRIDTWTKGYYSKRLLIGVPVVIIMILAALLATIP